MTAAVPLQPVEFDPCGELPTGVTVLEASAGTGKTYTIAALAARYVAEGTPLERLLLVTFTRIATGELRERVRERLVTVERGLARRLAGAAAEASEDPVVTLLAAGNAATARERLAHAIAGFDGATIATTHGFCQEVLGGLGIAGDLEPDVTFAEDLSDLVSDVVDDLYVRRFSRGDPPPFGRAQAAAIARAAIANPSAAIVGGDTEVAMMRRRLAERAREELERRKRTMAVMTYDDLVSRLRAALEGPGHEATTAQLRARFEVVLVDEFQDTDPAQWQIMKRAFADGGATLVLIADPKQAIYAFRGADVYAYLEAASSATRQATLPINWRSDQGLIDAHDALFSGVRLGHQGIAYRQVRAAPEHQAPGLTGAPVAAPLRVRVVLGEDPGVSLTRGGYVETGPARQHIACDVAADIVALLHCGARVAAGTAADAGSEPVRPAHLAVLVRTNRQAAMIREALQEAGVPAVINGAGSVFGTEPAREWLRLLEALERPASIARAHSAALTCFIGWSAEQLAAEEDSPAWEEVHRRLHDWARILRTRGVASLVEAIMRHGGGDAGGAAPDPAAEALPGRVLGTETGERRLTDVRHIGQLLHGASTAEQLGPTALTGWLRTRIAEAEQDTADEERSRRLESDAEAVQVLTIHRSKGLEFPIVYLPFLWDIGWISDDPEPVFFHDPAAGDARTLDVGLEGAGYQAHRRQYVAEQRGEDLRLAYVALTRARHQVTVWWAGTYGSRNSPLARLLFSREQNGQVAPSGSSTPGDEAMLARLRTLSDSAGGRSVISVERSELGKPSAWSPPLPQVADLDVAVFNRPLDLRWRRTSYSDITAASHDAWVTSEPEQPLLADEPPGPAAPPLAEPAQAQLALDTPSLLAQMPAGVDVGTFVHRVMEATDFAAPDLEAELALRIDEVQGARAVDVGPLTALAAGLRAVIETPLGPVLGGIRLRDVARHNRLDELGFELPLAGGDRPSGALTLRRIAAVLREHTDDSDPLRAYADRLSDPRLRQSVRGYLNGSLDLVVRLAGPDGPRFAVLDYKTNWLAGPDEPLTAFHYRPQALAAEMLRHHYALQALLYAVALHRFLRWRLPGYDPARHLAGAAYLFVRGMTGPGAPAADGTPSGVFGWVAPAGLVPALSDALAGEEPDR
ncbi:MAG TPA: UvrD-helicase domain-containing protein [Solirubrobacteraceae bacterium]|nr:UvrD-helicase domain-containing protein [Solirubrobacteraceae bacterium]